MTTSTSTGGPLERKTHLNQKGNAGAFGARQQSSDELFARGRDLAHGIKAAAADPQRHLGVRIRSPLRVLDAVEHLAQTRPPGAPDHREVGVVLVDADDLVALERALAIDDEVDWKPHRQVRLQ